MPHWPEARIQVLASPSLGAAFVQYRMELDAGSGGTQAHDGSTESFLYVQSGGVELGYAADSDGSGAPSTGAPQAGELVALEAGGFALLPPTHSWSLKANANTEVLVVRKRYEKAADVDLFAPLIGNEADVVGEVYMGDEGALLQTLIPDEFQYDMAMNIFTFETGHSLPVTETHVMEHGLVVLQGKGLYYLEGRWMEVEESDFIWMGPYCPQSYYATGPVATRYLYYKNVNRDIPVA